MRSKKCRSVIFAYFPKLSPAQKLHVDFSVRANRQHLRSMGFAEDKAIPEAMDAQGPLPQFLDPDEDPPVTPIGDHRFPKEPEYYLRLSQAARLQGEPQTEPFIDL